MKPTIGRIVHYYAPDAEQGSDTPSAAIVVGLRSNDLVNLKVFEDNYSAPLHRPGVPENEPIDDFSGHWVWPPRE